ncbi:MULTISPECIES: tRNA dihydrouridine synthase DusB [unclassified Neptuniibacter]|uniref:tRNA dihydrouridine synthase DusB n=1 Tax=unclassified Neptuniibacter TaxID=2630693 RepID=UPI000C69EFB8|nr:MULTISPECIES: tRNA dihydrouridine synthase DusB [unclassified Neptuniibacter]MAY41609.1 tRNA dihydrouridine synthase DusB [Oceanospirillaceae bacterium]|tara:strand:- start:882 stop:1868 length:987 start_codon:yes stop_codon:yes gene_type:complete
MFKIGPYTIDSQVILAPMAGVTDRPFRQLCKRMGAGLVVSEMVTSDTRLWKSRKSTYRLNHTGEVEPRSIQIAGGDPEMMADAAVMNVQRGAQIIDINMGCPAKKVCNKAAGSALLKDEQLVSDILHAVTEAVDVPVTLKIRTGWDTNNKNALSVAHIAEDAGIQALAVHGRTRSCGYKGEAEYDTIASIAEAISIPVFANGDITSPEKALKVLQHTGCSAVMIGRAAQGRPWLLREIDHYLRTGTILPPPKLEEVKSTLLAHLQELHSFYGDYLGVRIARKHVGWYLQNKPDGSNFRKRFNIIETAAEQASAIEEYFDNALNNGVAA